MEEWMRQSVSQLKKLVKGRAGRVAELQMEIKILEGIIERKVSQGDLGGSSSSTAASKPAPEQGNAPVEPAPAEVKATQATPDAAAESEPKPTEPMTKTEQTKITVKSSSHAFKEID